MKRLLSYAKYPVALAILFFVLREADGARIAQQLLATPPVALLAACMAFFLAQLFAVARMNAYYARAGRPLPFGYALRLHYAALFYNIVLPGGIGGDGYKIYALKKRGDYPVGEGIRIQLLTRLNGLLILLLSLLVLLPLLPLPVASLPLGIGCLLCAVAGSMLYFALIPRLLKGDAAMERRALPYSLGVQGCNLLCMVCLWAGLSDGSHLAEYVFLFQVAAVAGMIPITIGGLGLREFTFFYGAEWMSRFGTQPLDAELGVVISLLFFAVTALHAVVGVVAMKR